jgi:rfaE bifunctional protein kinase chain/domain
MSQETSGLRKIVDRFKSKRIVVFGDLVADVFVYGEISRISREAPVLILSHRESQLVPGGAANAVHNLWALGAKPLPVGLIGDDKEGQQLLDYFSNLGIDTRGITVAKKYRTPAKMRILGGAVHSQRQQIVRVDSGAPLEDDKLRSAVQKKLQTALKNADALIVSDYGFGLAMPETLSKARRDSMPTTIDSRFSMMEFSRLTAATPNEPEVEAALGITIGTDARKLERAGRMLLRKLKHEAVLITRGKDGMALFERGKRTIHIPIHGSDEVADVTGAGDTVIATFTLALAAGASYHDAARLANYAGGIVVMKYGTRPVMRKELIEVLDSDVGEVQ